MKTFFTEQEREHLRELDKGKFQRLFDVFRANEESRQRTLQSQMSNREYGLDYLDITLGALEPDALAELVKEENRAKVMEVLEGWAGFYGVDFAAAAIYLSGELGVAGSLDPNNKKPLSKSLDLALDKTRLAKQLVGLTGRFPLLFIDHQFNDILTSERDGLVSMGPQAEFLDGLSLDDIANGRIDFRRLRDINRVYTPFHLLC